MKVTVDGIIYSLQSRGGISRTYHEILPRMCNIDPVLEISLLIFNHPQQALPRHASICTSNLIPTIEQMLRPRRLWRPIVPAIKGLAKQLWLARFRGNIWHSTYYTYPQIWNGPIIISVYDMIFEMFPEQFNRQEDEELRDQKRKCLLRADAIISNSETTKQDVINFYGIQPEKIHAIRLGFSSVFKQLRDDEIDPNQRFLRPFLLYVGKRSHNKNFGTLARAYSAWNRKNEIKLIVVGEPWTKYEQESMLKLDIAGKVQLIENASDKDLNILYNQAFAFIYPSLYEGFGIPLLEAMACGCPVVASRIPSTEEVAGEFPVYFEPQETDSLIDALDKVYSEGRGSDRVLLGMKKAQTYSWDRTAKQTLEVYDSLK